MNEKEKNSVIQFEVERAEKANWVRKANDLGLKLAAYIRARVNGDL